MPYTDLKTQGGAGILCDICNTIFNHFSEYNAHLTDIPCEAPTDKGFELDGPTPNGQFNFSHVKIGPIAFCETCRGQYDPTGGKKCRICNPHQDIPRAQILEAAKNHTVGDRNETHGDPIPMMELFMDLAQPIIDAKDIPKAMKGALILDAHKTARMLYNPLHMDSFEDGCAYTAIAGEAAIRAQCKAPDSP